MPTKRRRLNDGLKAALRLSGANDRCNAAAKAEQRCGSAERRSAQRVGCSSDEVGRQKRSNDKHAALSPSSAGRGVGVRVPAPTLVPLPRPRPHGNQPVQRATPTPVANRRLFAPDITRCARLRPPTPFRASHSEARWPRPAALGRHLRYSTRVSRLTTPRSFSSARRWWRWWPVAVVRPATESRKESRLDHCRAVPAPGR
ncbi:UNVERIFIED_ORG: hypothetical protein ABIB63_002396 [Xanthomonas axonopodis]